MRTLVVASILGVAAALAVGCGGGGGGPGGPPRLDGIGFGVTFSPRGFTTTMTVDDLVAFYRDHAETGP